MKMSNYPKETDERMKAKTAIELLKDIQNDIRHYACIYPNVNDSYLNKLVAEVYLADAIDKLKKYEKSDKYRWHDLRKDPKDLPDKDGIYMVCIIFHAEEKAVGAAFYGIMYGYKSGGDMLMPNDGKVIAWREIERFETDET